MKLVIIVLLLGSTVYGLAQGERCGRSTLDPLTTSGFDFIATCEEQNDEMLVSVTVRRRSVAEIPSGIVPKELRRLKLSFSGVFAGAAGPPGYQVVTDITDQPKRLSVTWIRTDAVVDNVESDLSGFTVRLRGKESAITCPHEFAADTIVGGLTCGIPPLPANKPLQPTRGEWFRLLRMMALTRHDVTRTLTDAGG